MAKFHVSKEAWSIMIQLTKESTEVAAYWYAQYRLHKTLNHLNRYNKWRKITIRNVRLLEKWAQVPHRPDKACKPRPEYLDHEPSLPVPTR